MQRRKFISQMALLAGGLATAGCWPLNALATDKKKNILKGRVLAQGRGLKGVVVSDGFSVIVTDKKGRYELTPDKSAQFITVSVPAGFHFLQENNISRCYQPIVGKKESYDFELQPLSM